VAVNLRPFSGPCCALRQCWTWARCGGVVWGVGVAFRRHVDRRARALLSAVVSGWISVPAARRFSRLLGVWPRLRPLVLGPRPARLGRPPFACFQFPPALGSGMGGSAASAGGPLASAWARSAAILRSSGFESTQRRLSRFTRAQHRYESWPTSSTHETG